MMKDRCMVGATPGQRAAPGGKAAVHPEAGPVPVPEARFQGALRPGRALPAAHPQGVLPEAGAHLAGAAAVTEVPAMGAATGSTGGRMISRSLPLAACF